MNQTVHKFSLQNVGQFWGDDERAFIVLFGRVEAGCFIVEGQNWVPGYVENISGNYGDPSTTMVYNDDGRLPGSWQHRLITGVSVLSPTVVKIIWTRFLLRDIMFDYSRSGVVYQTVSVKSLEHRHVAAPSSPRYHCVPFSENTPGPPLLPHSAVQITPTCPHHEAPQQQTRRSQHQTHRLLSQQTDREDDVGETQEGLRCQNNTSVFKDHVIIKQHSRTDPSTHRLYDLNSLFHRLLLRLQNMHDPSSWLNLLEILTHLHRGEYRGA